MEFRKQRLQALEDAVAAKKVDEGIIKLLEKINDNSDLVTTSSCFGRITLLEFDLNKRKQTAAFFRKWHHKVDLEEVEIAASSHDGKLPLWFKVEPFILHVSAKDYPAAEAFMLKMRAAGVKRGGIQGAMKDKVPVEVQGTVWMSVPIDAIEPRWELLTAVANKMLDINAAQVRKLEKIKW
ncbi:MAG: hypothetical protein V1492_00390 [Candidatus Micrarchaeota archaeon]